MAMGGEGLASSLSAATSLGDSLTLPTASPWVPSLSRFDGYRRAGLPD